MTLSVNDIEVLNTIYNKLSSNLKLSRKDRTVLSEFLYGLPSINKILTERFPLNDLFEVELYSVEQMRPHIQKWIRLFNRLPREISRFGIHAGWLDGQEDDSFWETNVVIEGEFIPTQQLSTRKDDGCLSIGIILKADGTATFKFADLRLAERFTDLYNFNGSWKEAYLLVAKTLQQGWPQTKFPLEFEQFLTKE